MVGMLCSLVLGVPKLGCFWPRGGSARPFHPSGCVGGERMCVLEALAEL